MRRSTLLLVVALQVGAFLVVLPQPADAAPAPFPGVQVFGHPLTGFKQVYTVGSADGGVNGVRFVFKGPIDAIALHADYLEIQPGSCKCLNPRVEVPRGPDGYTNNFTLWFEPEMPSSIRPVVTYHREISGGGAVHDPIRSLPNVDGFTPMAESEIEAIAAVDLVPPSILNAATMDRDGDGLIDAYCISFTEAIRDSSFKIGQWGVAGTTPKPPVLDPGCEDTHGATDVPDDALLTLPFDETTALNTGSLPQLTYILVGTEGLRDLTFGNSMQDISAPRVFEHDGVRARLIRTYAQVGSKDVFAVFSEPVKHTVSSAISPNDFTYNGAAGDTALQSVATTAGSAIVRLVLKVAATTDDIQLDGADLTFDTLDLKDADANGEADTLQDLAAPTANKVLRLSGAPLTRDLNPPAPVESLAVQSITQAGASLAWTSPDDIDLAHLEVKIQAQGQNTPWGDMTRVANVTGKPGAPQTLALGGLSAFRSYEIAVGAVDASKNIDLGRIVRATFTTTATATATAPGTGTGNTGSGATETLPLPGTVTGLAVEEGSLASREAVLRWTMPSSGPEIKSLQVRYSALGLTNDTFLAALEANDVPAPAEEGADQRMLLTGLQPGTAYTVGIRTVRQSGGNGPLATATFVTAADATPPAGPLALGASDRTSGQASPHRSATFSWPAVTDADGPVTYRYRLDHSATGNATLLDPEVDGDMQLALADLADGSWFLHLGAFSDGGSVQAAPFNLVVDGTPPAPIADLEAGDVTAGSVNLSWTAPGGDGENGTATRYHVRHVAGSQFSEEQWMAATDVAGAPAPAKAGALQTFQVKGLVPGSNLTFAVRAGDAAGNLGDLVSSAAVVLPDDLTPPEGQLAATLAGILPSGRILGPDLQVALSGASDPDAAHWYRYAVTQDESHEFSEADTRSDDPSFALPSLKEGSWVLHARVESYGGFGSHKSLPFEVVLLSPEEIESFNEEITLIVTRDDQANRLAWSLPDGLAVPPQGLQLWASNSPYALVGTILSTEQAFAASSFEHTGEQARSTTRYLVTAFFGPTPELGFFDGEAAGPSTAQYPGEAAPRDLWDDPALRWGGVGVGVLALTGAVIGSFWLLRRRRAAAIPAPTIGLEGAETWLPSDDENRADQPPTEPDADSREVACYQCSTVYAAVGALPLETECPGCGARGMLGM